MTQASVVIPTRNRGTELAALLQSLRAQTVPLEVLVMDDGANNETRLLVETEFPEVVYHRLGYSKGPAFQRNHGIKLSRNNIVFPLDDDTELPSPNTIAQTLNLFDDPRIGAVGIPFINVRQDSIVQQRVPDHAGVYLIHAFVGAAHAIRRDTFLQVGGYREHFFYMGEEGDLCLRLLQAGYFTALAASDPIYHFESLIRNSQLSDFCGRRNDILFAWHNVPTTYLPLHLIGSIVNGFWAMQRTQHPGRMLAGLASGLAGIWEQWHERSPARAQTYRLFRELKKHGPKLLREIDARPGFLHAESPAPSHLVPDQRAK